MSTKLRYASAISIAATFITVLFSTNGSGAAAQNLPVQTLEVPATPVVSTAPAVSTTDAQVTTPYQVELLPDAQDTATPDSRNAQATAASLGALVAATPVPGQLSSELNCLAGAIYFEAKGETLAGQLAVGRVIVARSRSGRFPASYCGVVYQRSQFSFIRGAAMPAINKDGRMWTNAVRIAQIANEGSWKSPVEGALFFHAASVSPRWHLTRLARIDNHVFYR